MRSSLFARLGSGVKGWMQRSLPQPYQEARELYYLLQGWAQERRQHYPEAKRFEFAVRKLARDMGRYPEKAGLPRCLFFAFEGHPLHIGYHAILAMRLRQLGHPVEIVQCRQSVPFCTTGQYRTAEQPCAWCMKLKDGYFQGTFPSRALPPPGAECRRLMAEAASWSVDECLRFEWNGVPVGRMCKVSLCWYLCKGWLGEEDIAHVRKAVQSALVVADTFDRVLDESRPERVMLFNGALYTAAVATFLCQRRGIVSYSHEMGIGQDCVFFSMTSPGAAHYVDETYPPFRHRPLTPDQLRRLDDVLRARRAGKTMTLMWAEMESEAGKVRRQLGLDDRPIAVLFAHVTWDTTTLIAERVFPSQMSWILETAQWFAAHPEYQLVVRAHPADAVYSGGRTQDVVEELLKKHMSPMPENVKIVESASPISSYTLMDLAAVGLVYASTTGVEMVYAGRQVVVAGRAKYSGYGVALEPSDADEYFRMTGEALAGRCPVTEDQQEQVRRFAYHYFFERMIPFEPIAVNLRTFEPTLKVRSLRALERAKSPGFELICRSISEGKPVVWENK